MNRRFRRWGAWVLGALVATLVAAFGVFLIDSALHNGRVARNVTIDGRHVGGVDRVALDRRLQSLSTEALGRPLRLQDGDRAIEVTLGEVGVGMDVARLRSDVLAAAREKTPAGGFWSWWSSFFTPREVGTTFVAEPGIAETFIAGLPEARPFEPVEPTYTGITGSLVVTPGIDGLALDPAAAAAAVATLAGPGYPAMTVDVTWQPVPPRVDAAALQASLEAADAMAIDLGVFVNGHTATIGRGTVMTWIESDLTPSGLTPRFDLDRAEASVERLLAGFVDPGTAPVFTVVDGEVTAELGAEPLRCCAEGFGADLEASALTGNRTLVMLPPTPVYPDAGRAAVAALGVEERIAEFTTNHRCCESRVENIHRIADLVRGVVIEPGGRFSINEYVGFRTRENGFVAAGVIESGHFTDDVGGGISQFATTMFNAAFFAGLDFESYQSHTIYLSRYPYGREATLSFPEPDLIVTNPTPYAMLLWTSYTDTSITVEIYSTPYFVVEQTRQARFRWGRACTRVNTYRERTAPDGTVLEDFVFATYRPGEGLDCNGNATPKPTG